MTAEAPVNTAEQRKETTIPWQEFEATLLESLEISSYDLAVLEHHLVAVKWVPSSTDEDAIKEAVFKFRQSYKSADYKHRSIFSDNERLVRLFECWSEEEVERDEIDFAESGHKAFYELVVKRETAKYNAVRALISHLTVRKSAKGSTGGLPDITDEQAGELLQTNARLRTIFFNNVKKSLERETKALSQKIAEKDAEIAGMLKSLS